jgi:hypothetical protein
MYSGCISGAIQRNDYLDLIKKNGFENLTVQKEKIISLPADILKEHLNDEEIAAFQSGGAGIFSVTVYAEKPVELKACCEPGCC